jgi:Asp-tRNA(Asn)/Glu-tRNA(Gln) amidotransferase A subunit family amidase
MEPGGRIIVALGGTVTALETLAADRIRAWAFDYVTRLFREQRLTAIVNPTVGVEVPVLSEEAKLRGESNTPLVVRMMKYIFIANLLGLPGYSVPVGQVPAEADPSLLLPVGLHFLGDHWQDHKVRQRTVRCCACVVFRIVLHVVVHDFALPDQATVLATALT